MAYDDHNVTITILDVSLSLVHIPRFRLDQLSRPVLKQLLRKNPKFLSLTANALELSIFAEDDELDDFEPLARRDRHKLQKYSSIPGPSTSDEQRRRRSSHIGSGTVEMSPDKWRVLQIDSHNDSLSTYSIIQMFFSVTISYPRYYLGDSGSRVRELSAPLAAAGISILYQSSYLSDFIFVKDSRLPAVMKHLGKAGFTLYNTDLYDLAEGSFVDESMWYGSMPPTPGGMTPAILSRTQNPSSSSIAALSHPLSRQGTFDDLSSSAFLIMHRSKMAESPKTSPSASRTPKKSLSPAAAHVEVLNPVIACVGLNESSSDIWTTKLLTLVGYPELIPSTTSSWSPAHTDQFDKRASLAESLYGSMQYMRESRFRGNGNVDDLIQFNGDDDSGAPTPENQLNIDGFSVGAKGNSSTSADSSPPDSPLTPSSSGNSSSDDEYFSSSPSPYEDEVPPRSRQVSASSPAQSAASSSSTRSLPDRFDTHHISLSNLSRFARPKFARGITSEPSPVGEVEEEVGRDYALVESIPHSHSRSRSQRQRKARAPVPPLRVPYFSFTRTTEGSSLTTDLAALAALFTPEERHMIISPESLLDEGDRLNNIIGSSSTGLSLNQDEQRLVDSLATAINKEIGYQDADGQILDPPTFVADEELLPDGGEEEEGCVPGTMKCLQIDLQKFGLGAYRFFTAFTL
jgi:hypothetical protein